MSIVDYTKLPIGAAPSREGTVQKCPVCGLNGQRRAVRSKKKPWLFVHRFDATVQRKPSGMQYDTVMLAACESADPGENAPRPMEQAGLAHVRR